MKKYIVLHKKRGETPLMALTAWKQEHPAYADVPATYAGRLDPMAEGKLLILLGEECKRKREYEGLDKEYEIEVLLDVGSDTGDALGLVQLAVRQTRIDERVVRTLLQKEEGTHTRAYPAFSSKSVAGKPLFIYALEQTLGSIEIPTHDEQIYSIKLVGTRLMKSQELREYVDSFLEQVPHADESSKKLGADFRINEVRATWNKVFTHAEERSFAVLRLSVACASGTYMRTLAGRIGEALGTKALALSITRTKIGRRFLGFWIVSL